MSASLHDKTPTVTGIDSRGLPVRHIAYYRSEQSSASPSARITRQQYDSAGRLIKIWDPRQWELGLKANREMSYSLSGTQLAVDCVDSGPSQTLALATGQVGRRWDSSGNLWLTEYDRQSRPVKIIEQSSGRQRVAERFGYGDSSATSASRNCCARLIRHDDSAGTVSIDAYSLSGEALSQTRRLLLDAQLPDWPCALTERDALLESHAGHTTRWEYDSGGATVLQTDAAHHQQRFTFNVAGQLKAVHLKIRDEPVERAIISDIEYNAFGQIQAQRAANGVVSRATFDPASGRLTHLGAAVAGRTLQDLHYVFDAVGNVTSITDKAQQVSFANNQQVQAISRFTYDSLYQLTSASGREAQAAMAQPKLAPLHSLAIPVGQLFNYQQHYEYDSGGNLTTLRHVRDHNQYTRTMDIAHNSNRLVSWNDADARGVEARTDAAGNLLSLQPGQPLRWNSSGQLTGVTLVSRPDGQDDEERYVYDSGGQRIRKRRTSHGGTLTHHQDVIYLPGLELRSRNKERLEVITMQAGRCSIRYLHWTQGRPPETGTKQHLRYSLDDHCGSSTLELDDDARLISQEAFYPYGGTAWSVARSKIEADYKTVRYSGKERDSSGLYYYGHRYYAPWLYRWISADPAGTVDGLNLFCMVGNSPVRYADESGLQRFDSLNYLDIPDSAIENAPSAHLQEGPHHFYGKFSAETRLMTGTLDGSPMPAQAPAKPRKKINKRSNSDPGAYSKNQLRKYTAHAAYYRPGASAMVSRFHNFAGSPSGNNTFPGITSKPAVIPEHLQIKSFNAIQGKSKPGDNDYFLPPSDLGTYSVTDTKTFAAALDATYQANGATLHDQTRALILAHVDKHKDIPIRAGVAGLHADVQTINDIANKLPLKDGQFDSKGFNRALFDTVVFVQKLTSPGLNQNFPACGNCTGIIPDIVTVPTGILPLGHRSTAARRRHASG